MTNTRTHVLPLTVQPDARSLINESVELCQRGQFAEAERLCRRATILCPESEVAHNNLGWALEGQGDRKSAVACYLAAVEIDPQFDLGWQNLIGLSENISAETRASLLTLFDRCPFRSARKILNELIDAALANDDFDLASQAASKLSQILHGIDRSPDSDRYAVQHEPPVSLPKLRHDIAQLRFLVHSGRPVINATEILTIYESVIARVGSNPNGGWKPSEQDRIFMSPYYNRSSMWSRHGLSYPPWRCGAINYKSKASFVEMTV